MHIRHKSLNGKGRYMLTVALILTLVIQGFINLQLVAKAATGVGLGTASNFAVLAGSTVTNTGPTSISGNLGVSPGNAVTGFPPGIVVAPGSIQTGNGVALQAQNDITTAYNSLAGQPCNVDLTGQNLGGLNLLPGVYCFPSSAQLTGPLILNGGGDPNAVFIFQIGSTLTTASDSSVQLIGDATPCNVFWLIGSSATLGTRTKLAGNLIAQSSITLTTGVSIIGRALARTGAVTLDTSSVAPANCTPLAQCAIKGKVLLQGVPLPGPDGGVRLNGGSIRQTTDANGNYGYDNLKGGTYTISVDFDTNKYTAIEPSSITITIIDCRIISGVNFNLSLKQAITVIPTPTIAPPATLTPTVTDTLPPATLTPTITDTVPPATATSGSPTVTPTVGFPGLPPAGRTGEFQINNDDSLFGLLALLLVSISILLASYLLKNRRRN